MTEQQREDQLLFELLDLPEPADQLRTNDQKVIQSLLTRREEQALLRAARQVGTPTLAPDERAIDRDNAPHSFTSDLVAVARKYPVLGVVAVGGIAFLLARRRR